MYLPCISQVDLEEFVEFYAATLDDIEKEDKAREAFDKYDIDRSNTLEKHELFQASSALKYLSSEVVKQ